MSSSWICKTGNCVLAKSRRRPGCVDAPEFRLDRAYDLTDNSCPESIAGSGAGTADVGQMVQAEHPPALGVTAAEAVDAGPVPTALVAVIVKV